MADKKHLEKHSAGLSSYIKDIVYGANDGIITTFAIVAGVAGAGLSNAVIVILGIANLLADGFSMAASNYLGTRSENSLYREEEKREIYEVDNLPEKEKEEIREVFEREGFDDGQTEQLIGLVSSNKRFWVDFMMKYELEMSPPTEGSEWKAASLTFLSFVLAGALPLTPFILFSGNSANLLLYSSTATAVALFLVGAARYFITKKNWFISGLEMLLVGGVAAGVAYFVGSLIGGMM